MNGNVAVQCETRRDAFARAGAQSRPRATALVPTSAFSLTTTTPLRLLAVTRTTWMSTCIPQTTTAIASSSGTSGYRSRVAL